MPKLVALERFFYNGRNVEMGETFTVDEKDIALLTFVNTPKAKQPDRGEPEPEPEPEGKDKDKDKDKDKAAELGRTEKPKSETQAERKAATYKRRDMKAEG